MKEDTTTSKKPEPEMSYVTIVLRYFDKNKKTSHNVTDVMTALLEALQAYNKSTGYDGVKFELYGVCVEQDTDIAQAKNEAIKQING